VLSLTGSNHIVVASLSTIPVGSPLFAFPQTVIALFRFHITPHRRLSSCECCRVHASTRNPRSSRNRRVEGKTTTCDEFHRLANLAITSLDRNLITTQCSNSRAHLRARARRRRHAMPKEVTDTQRGRVKSSTRRQKDLKLARQNRRCKTQQQRTHYAGLPASPRNS
jgi:hypothetical protein